MIQPVTHDNENKSKQFSTNTCVPKPNRANFTISVQLVTPFSHECCAMASNMKQLCPKNTILSILMSFNLLCLHLHLDNWTFHRPHGSFLRSRLSPDSMLPAFVVTTPHTTAQRAIARSASISPPRQQAVEANRCNARSASLGTIYVQRTPSICTCYLRCLQLHLETIMYWWVKLICQLPCMHQTAPPKSSWVQKMQCKRLPMCYSHTMIQPLTNESGNKRKYFSMNPASAMTTERTTTNSTATNRSKQTVVHNTDKRWRVCCIFPVSLKRF